MKRAVLYLSIILLIGSCASYKPMQIDLSGLHYPDIDLDLNQIADIEYIRLTKSDSLKNDSTIYSFYDYDHTFYPTKKSIIVNRHTMYGEDNYIIKRSSICLFNKRGEFVKETTPDSSQNAYERFDIDKKNHIYVGMTFDNYFIFDDNLNLKKHPHLKYGTQGIFLLKGDRTLSYHRDKYYIRSKKDGLVLDDIKIYDNLDYEDYLIGNKFSISPNAIKTRRGYILPSVLSDTVRFVSKQGKISPYIINSKPIIFHQYDMWLIYPMVETKEYIFFTSTYKKDVYNNSSPKYYLYNKREKQMYKLIRDNSIMDELALAQGKCYFNHRNLTLAKGMAVEFFPFDFLHTNYENLPERLKQEASELTDKDSGVLMTIRFKKW